MPTPPPPPAAPVAAAFLLVLCQPLTLAADVGGDEGVQSVTLPGQIVLGESRTFFMWGRREREDSGRPRPDITHRGLMGSRGAKPITKLVGNTLSSGHSRATNAAVVSA